MKALQTYVLFYPAMQLLALLATWLAGRISLGHWPRPSLDDPKDIGGWFALPYGITTVLLVFGFPTFVAGVLSLLFRAYRDETRRRSLLLVSALSTASMVLAVIVLRWDPLRVAAWYID